MDVLMVTELFPPNCSGGGWSTYHLATALEEADGVALTVLAVNQDKVDDEGLEVETASVPRLPNERAYRAIAKEIREREDDYDVVQGQHSLTIPPLASVASPTAGVVRDYWPTCYRTTLRDRWGNNHLDCGTRCVASTTASWHVLSPYKFFNHYNRQRLAKQVDFLATKSDFVGDRLRAHGFENADTVHDFVTDAFTEDVGTEGEGDIIFFGKFTRNKGPQVLVEAIPDVLETYPEQRFTFFGIDENGFREELASRAEKLGIAENTEFLGYLPFEEVKARINGAKATVHPSQWHEPLSRVCIESMALGTPVISTATGGSPEIVEDGRNGLIFSGKEDLVSSLERIQDGEFREELSQGALDTVDRHFSKETVVERWKEIYADLASG